jgi:hypothetical protein
MAALARKVEFLGFIDDDSQEWMDDISETQDIEI